MRCDAKQDFIFLSEHTRSRTHLFRTHLFRTQLFRFRVRARLAFFGTLQLFHPTLVALLDVLEGTVFILFILTAHKGLDVGHLSQTQRE